jgi:hypothetical protein
MEMSSQQLRYTSLEFRERNEQERKERKSSLTFSIQSHGVR